MRRALRLLATVAALMGASAASAGKPERKLLAEMREACGGVAWDRVQGWHEKSEAEMKGMPLIQNDVWHDMKSLKSTMTSFVGGRIIRRTGFNGPTAWRIGSDGQVQTITDEGELRTQRRDAYLSSFAWFLPKRFPAKFRLLPDNNRDVQVYRVMRIAPENAEPFELWIDPKTRLVKRIVSGSEYAELSDYKNFDGVCTATTGRQGNGDPDKDIVLRVLNVKTTQRAPVTTFDPSKP